MDTAAGHVSVLRERAAAMVERIAFECRAVHVRGDVAMVRAAAAAALGVRDRLLEDDHDPRYLHPGRTVLILISDAECRTAEVLAAASFVESLPGDPHADAAMLDSRARTLLDEVPLPDGRDGDLLERLVTCDADAAKIAIAERLDHARHLHLMPDIAPAPFLETIEDVYIPAASRICPRMARRLERWAGAFARKQRRAGRRMIERRESGPG